MHLTSELPIPRRARINNNEPNCELPPLVYSFRGTYGRVYSLVHSFRGVLAASTDRACALSVGLVDAVAVSDRGNRGRRRAETGMGSRDASRTAIDGTVPVLGHSTPLVGTGSPSSFITICKSFQVSFFWRGSRNKNAGW